MRVKNNKKAGQHTVKLLPGRTGIYPVCQALLTLLRQQIKVSFSHSFVYSGEFTCEKIYQKLIIRYLQYLEDGFINIEYNVYNICKFSRINKISAYKEWEDMK